VRKKGELCAASIKRAYYVKYPTPKAQQLGTKAFTSVLEAYNLGICDLLLRGKEVKLPFRLGTVYVQKKKLNFNNLPFDYGTWRKTGQKLFHTNRHSDGYRAQFHWRKQLTALSGIQLYALVPCRSLTRAISQQMQAPGGHKQYQLYEPIFRKQKKHFPPSPGSHAAPLS
jgi:hypothetical protein